MKHNYYLLTMALLVVGTMSAFSQVSNDNEDEVYKIDARVGKNAYVPGQVLLKFKDDSPVKVNRTRGVFNSVDNNAISAVLKEFGVNKMDKLLPNENPNRTLRKTRAFNGETIKEHDLSQLYLVEVDEAHAPQTMQLVDQLKQLEAVEYAEPNYKVYLTDATIDGFSGGNPYAASQWYLEDYGVTALWNKPIINPKRPVIAILDTGVDITHPDLSPNLWTNAGEDQGEDGYDNDRNGFKNDLHGWDFINNTGKIRDFNMHGTHVAGIAAAANNGIGIVGANPKAYIMPVTVMQSDGTGDVATIVKGINYAVANGATILNLSLGTYANSSAMRQALESAYQKAVIVAAAGNDGLQILPVCKPREPYGPMFPAAYSFVLGVQATQSDGSLAAFSNYDCDGNTFSSATTLQDPDGFNYELKAPGTSMLSTIPGGKYKVLQGTSMAAPLVAGAISALKMVKQYDSQEILWGDLLHTNNIAQAYAVTKRPAELDLMKIMYRERKELTEQTEEDYSGDGRIDAGETVSLYPVIRTTFGPASNIKMYLAMGDEFEDPNTVQILTGADKKVDFGLHLDAYGKGVSLNPLKLKVAENVANGRHIKMKFIATCDESNTIYEGLFTIVVDNMRKISGLINEDMTLTANHEWLVSSSVAIPQGVTVTIEPGTIIRLNSDCSIVCNGNLIANGTPDKMITFTKNEGKSLWGYVSAGDTVRYCIFEYGSFGYDLHNHNRKLPHLLNCILRNNRATYMLDYGINSITKSNFYDNCSNTAYVGSGGSIKPNLYTNIINNQSGNTPEFAIKWSRLNNANFYNNGKAVIGCFSTEPIVEKSQNPSYLGSSDVNIVRNSCIYDLTTSNETFATVDLSNMPSRPYSEAHGIVWKVCVNGKDAQDEYDDLSPLGVGKHKFEVYFNRPMNKAVVPQITFGVRDPWTQNAVAEDGSWNEEGTIYTAYKTITGKTKSDGVNRIYVWGAEDNEFFEIPYEKTRFNFMINAAGSMATGFAAEAKMGRVELTWNNENNDFEDAMGFNIYRYQLNDNGDEINNICINKEIVDIETTEYVDYDVTPGTTYYYMYKVLSTDLKEYDVSNVVAVTPLTSSLGDANGSGEVEVTDVITTVNYAAGMEPKPFIFEAADVNVDLAIDILDVVGIIQKVLNPTAGARVATRTDDEAMAIYTIEDGVLYVESPVALGGVQVQLNLPRKADIVVADDLNGFEHTSSWLSDNDYLFMAYNLSGKTLPAGKHALLKIGDAEITKLILSNTRGGLVPNNSGDGTTNIDAMGAKVMQQGGIFNLKGQKISGKTSDLEKLPKGVYIINGEKVVK